MVSDWQASLARARQLDTLKAKEEQEAAAKASEKVGAATKQVKDNELEWIKGVGLGAVAALGSSLVELKNSYNGEDTTGDIQTFSQKWFEDKFNANASEARKSGYELGNVVGYLTDPGIGMPMAAVGAAGKVEDMVEFLARQAADMKGSKSHTNMDPDRFQEYKEFLKQHGLDWEKVIPMRFGEKQPGANPVSNKPVLWDAEGSRIRDPAGVPSSQHETNPQARAGAPPSGYGNPSQAAEEGGQFATREIKDFRAHVEETLASRAVAASKGKSRKAAVAAPEFWIYDKKLDKIIVVKRNAKTGVLEVKPASSATQTVLETKTALQVEREQGKIPEEYTGKVLFDENGGVTTKTIESLNPKIDMVVESGAKEKIDKMIYESMLERLDMK